jgi:hypothetical protein
MWFGLVFLQTVADSFPQCQMKSKVPHAGSCRIDGADNERTGFCYSQNSCRADNRRKKKIFVNQMMRLFHFPTYWPSQIFSAGWKVTVTWPSKEREVSRTFTSDGGAIFSDPRWPKLFSYYYPQKNPDFLFNIKRKKSLCGSRSSSSKDLCLYYTQWPLNLLFPCSLVD